MMRRFVLAPGVCLIALTLMAAAPAAEQSKKPEPKSKPAAKADSAAEKTEKAEAKPEAPAAKPEAPKAKPEAEAKAKPPAAKPPIAKPPAAKPPTAPTHTVKPELFKIDVSLDGGFEAQAMSEVALKPKAWASFKVLKAVEHGRSVQKGDVLVQFDSKDIDKAVADRKTTRELADLTFKQAEISLELLEKMTPMELALADRDKREADQDLDRFLKIDLPLSRKSSEQSLKTSQNYLEYELEELRQLEKMYKADDLTEETEEIILKRQRDLVERYKFYLEQSKVYHDETIKVSLPRREESIKRYTRVIELTTGKAKETLPLTLRQQQLEMEKIKVQRTRDDEKFKELLGDQSLMTIKSPADGVVYYGKWTDGQWSGGSTMAQKLRPKQAVAPGSVLMTVLSPRPLMVRVTVPENQLHWIRPGLKGTVQPVAYPDLRASASIASVNTTPRADGKFVATLRVALDAEGDAIMPGMKCKVKMIPYLKKRTLTVPAAAVKTDELDDQKHYVQLVDESGRSKKQPITIGKKTASKVEILDGLVAGDKVLAQYPKDKP